MTKADGSLHKDAAEFLAAVPCSVLCFDCTEIARPGYIKELSTVQCKLDSLLQGQTKLVAGQTKLAQGQTKLTDGQRDLGTKVEVESAKTLDVSANNTFALPDAETWAEVVSRKTKQATKAAFKEVAKEEADAEERSRSLVLDNLPEPKEGETELDNVNLLFGRLEVPVKVKKVYRLGRGRAGQEGQRGGNRPAKTKVVLETAAEQREVLRREVREKLRQREWERNYPRLYLNPSRTSDERHTLWLLRQRRAALNKNLGPNDQWILDSIRFRLWKKEGGQVNRRVRDADISSWASTFDGPPSPSRDGDNTLFATPASASARTHNRPF